MSVCLTPGNWCSILTRQSKSCSRWWGCLLGTVTQTRPSRRRRLLLTSGRWRSCYTWIAWMVCRTGQRSSRKIIVYIYTFIKVCWAWKIYSALRLPWMSGVCGIWDLGMVEMNKKEADSLSIPSNPLSTSRKDRTFLGSSSSTRNDLYFVKFYIRFRLKLFCSIEGSVQQHNMWLWLYVKFSLPLYKEIGVYKWGEVWCWSVSVWLTPSITDGYNVFYF